MLITAELSLQPRYIFLKNPLKEVRFILSYNFVEISRFHGRKDGKAGAHCPLCHLWKAAAFHVAVNQKAIDKENFVRKKTITVAAVKWA